MKVTSPAASAWTSRPHALAWEGFQAAPPFDSRAAHLQMFLHLQHMHTDMQEHYHNRAHVDFKERAKKEGPDEVLTRAQPQYCGSDGVGFIIAEWVIQRL